jgi:transposase
MGKATEAGIDVSKDVLAVAVRRDGTRDETARFPNDAAGHGALVRWLTKRGRTARVVLESTGVYSLDVALALYAARGVAVMVANPRAIKPFAGTLMQRSKTDLMAAVALREYATRMPFVAWEPPAAEVLALRGIARRIAAAFARFASSFSWSSDCSVRGRSRIVFAEASTSLGFTRPSTPQRFSISVRAASMSSALAS